jgi:hypothetical protein
MQTIKAIETNYKGFRFRSRTEARWAVFFDCLGWEWVYEAEGYSLPCGYYLPDFFFPKINAFAEVKPGSFDLSDVDKCLELSKLKILGEDVTVILLEGPPSTKCYSSFVDGFLVSDIVPVSKKDKYYPFYYTATFFENYFHDTEAAVVAAKSARFEYGEKPSF